MHLDTVGMMEKIGSKTSLNNKKGSAKALLPSALPLCYLHKKTDQIFGPEATKALPASFVVNFLKFSINCTARSLAFSSQIFGSS